MTTENLVSSPIQEGDAGIILRKDGGFEVFNTHKDIDPNALTDVQLDQGRKLMALSVALQIPEIMETLFKMSQDPNIVGKQFEGQTH